MISNQFLVGDLFTLAQPHDTIVIPTNIGWTSTGDAVMGAGLAKQLLAREPAIARAYGSILQSWWCGVQDARRDRKPIAPLVTPFVLTAPAGSGYASPVHVLLVPTKPMRLGAPNLSWNGAARSSCVRRSIQGLGEWAAEHNGSGRLLIPLLGCGHGGAPIETVLPWLRWLIETYTFAYIVVSKRDLEPGAAMGVPVQAGLALRPYLSAQEQQGWVDDFGLRWA